MENLKDQYCNFCGSEDLPSGVWGCSDCEPKELKSKIIVGDTVATKQLKPIYLKPNNKLKVTKIKGGMIEVQITRLISKNEIVKIGESQMQYEESNCYKLKQAIKKTGISSEKLSLATTKGKTKYHFYSYTKKSRLTDRGDISDARLNKLLTYLRHAEREVLGIGAKTVDDAVEEAKKALDTFITYNQPKEKPNQETIDAINAECDSDVFLTAQDLANSVKEKPKSNKPLFIGASVVIFIILILFILNNYLQVV